MRNNRLCNQVNSTSYEETSPVDSYGHFRIHMHGLDPYPEQAQKRATSTPATRAATIDSRDFDLSYSTVTESGLPAVYIFQGSKDTGFLVVSADDVAYPLLGYSDSGSFDPENIPEAMKGWLNEYARRIEYASSRGISMQSSLREAKQ